MRAAPPPDVLSFAPSPMPRPMLALDHLPDGVQCLATDTVEPAELPEAIRRGAIVIDVRSEAERADGRITGSLHVPFEQWSRDGLDASAADVVASAGGRQLIFHCMYSRERGPTCARIAAASHPEASIALLRGGFQQVMAQLWNDSAPQSALIEGVRRDRWVEGPGRVGLVWGPDAEPLRYAGAALSALTARPDEIDSEAVAWLRAAPRPGPARCWLNCVPPGRALAAALAEARALVHCPGGGCTHWLCSTDMPRCALERLARAVMLFHSDAVQQEDAAPPPPPMAGVEWWVQVRAPAARAAHARACAEVGGGGHLWGRVGRALFCSTRRLVLNREAFYARRLHAPAQRLIAPGRACACSGVRVRSICLIARACACLHHASCRSQRLPAYALNDGRARVCARGWAGARRR